LLNYVVVLHIFAWCCLYFNIAATDVALVAIVAAAIAVCITVAFALPIFVSSGVVVAFVDNLLSIRQQK